MRRDLKCGVKSESKGSQSEKATHCMIANIGHQGKTITTVKRLVAARGSGGGIWEWMGGAWAVFRAVNCLYDAVMVDT